MSKAERRKRARQRAKERERATVAAEPRAATTTLDAGGVASLEVATAFAEPEPAVSQAVFDTSSDFITGPVVPRVPGPARKARPELPAPASSPLRVVPEVAAPAANDELEDEQDEDEEDDGEEDEDDDDQEDDDEAIDEQDALFNLACAAVEEGDKLTWNELVTWMLAAEVEDPRLATLAALLATDEDVSEVPKLTGQRVLEVLETIGLGEIVTEARETVAAAPKGDEESEEERALVRTTARELTAQAKEQLGTPASKPIKPSAVRAARSASGRARG